MELREAAEETVQSESSSLHTAAMNADRSLGLNAGEQGDKDWRHKRELFSTSFYFFREIGVRINQDKVPGIYSVRLEI